MKVILGLNWGHDGAAAIVRDGRLVCAVSLERLTRKKKDSGISAELLSYVCEEAGVAPAEISAVAMAAFIPSPSSPVRLFRKSGEELTTPVFDLFGGDTFFELEAQIEGRRVPAFFINHHIAHSAAAFFTSPFERAACLSVDASMFRPEACSLMSYGEGTDLRYLRCPGIMIGNAYSVFTGKLGLGPGLTKAGTLMGLAPYGKPNAVALERWREFGASFYERQFQQSDSVFIQYIWSMIAGIAPHAAFDPSISDSPKAQEVAASIQYVFEQTLLMNAQRLREDTNEYSDGNLCLSGGSFLNSEVNMLIKRESGFKRLHLFPGCGDDGTAVGSALFVAHTIGKLPRQQYASRELAYLGKSYPTPLNLSNASPVTPLAIARMLSEGKIVGLFHGRGEFGPRALGNRSILADPRRAEVKDYLNAQVKRREWFRPFAPSVMSEFRYEWFDCEEESPFMLLIAKVKKPELIPAVSHVDGTARVQTVTKRDNPYFHSILAEFFSLTEVPVLLNTSMNGNGEPLVETPNDALRFFQQGKIDALVINDQVVVAT
jgi:carbamoyltransferase